MERHPGTGTLCRGYYFGSSPAVTPLPVRFASSGGALTWDQARARSSECLGIAVADPAQKVVVDYSAPLAAIGR